MSYTNVYPSRINWENEPSIASPINATNLNKIDYAVYEHDQTFETWDVTKANQSDLLLSVKSIDYDTTTGVFVFTWQNGTTKTVDLNIEKIPVSFSMSAQGVITMTTEDGTQYTADVGSLIKTYTFDDSTEIDFTVTTDASGNKTVTAALKDGSIVGTKLEPNYLANCQSAANSASASKTAAEGSAEDSEAWAVGTRDGVPVPSTDPAYENNSYYWATHGASASFAGLTDTSITNPQNGQVPVYNSTSQKWENADQSAGGGSTVVVNTSDSSLYGQTVTITQGGTTLTGTFSNSGVATFEGVTLTGTVTIASQSTSMTYELPYFGNYSITLTTFQASITVTYPNGATCTCSKDGTTYTATGSPYTFTVTESGTWVVSVTSGGTTKTQNVSITTSGQSESVNMVTENLTVTIYSAVEDLISFTDAAGVSRTEQLATGQSSKSITFAINKFGNTSIAFTSSVAKNPDSLSDAYSKTVTITNATTEIKVMPDNSLYWWGYYNSEELDVVSNTTGWTTSSVTFVDPTFNTQNITMNSTGSNAKVSGVATKNTVTGTLKTIVRTSTTGGQYGGRSVKTVGAPSPDVSVNYSVDTLASANLSGVYGVLWSYSTTSNIMSALWYE
jgi:hypothetical protein